MTMNPKEAKNLLLAVGKAQVDAMFRRQSEGPAIDDSEFLPLVEVVVDAFATAVERWSPSFGSTPSTCTTGRARRLNRTHRAKKTGGSCRGIS